MHIFIFIIFGDPSIINNMYIEFRSYIIMLHSSIICLSSYIWGPISCSKLITFTIFRVLRGCSLVLRSLSIFSEASELHSPNPSRSSIIYNIHYLTVKVGAKTVINYYYFLILFSFSCQPRSHDIEPFSHSDFNISIIVYSFS